MPPSITSVRQITNDAKGFSAAVNQCDSLSELLELVPAPFRPRTQDLVNRVYKAAVKSNNARSYLSTLEKHMLDGTFPPEIGGRVNIPMVQTSKEYMATAEFKQQATARDHQTRTHKIAMLTSVIASKQTEITYLQSLFSEQAYARDLDAIETDVITSLSSDAVIQPLADGKPDISALPSWIKLDADKFRNTKAMYPQRAIALAYATVQREMSKKFKSLTLKKRTDEDEDMLDAPSKSETVDALVTRKVEQLMKEYKKSTPGMNHSPPDYQETEFITDTPRQRKGSKDSKAQPKEKFETADSEGHQSRRRKRKRERREEEQREVSKLDRALRGFCESTGETALVPDPRLVPLTGLSKERTLVSTDVAYQYLNSHSELFCGVSQKGRQQFVAHHTPVSLFEMGHRFAEGIFKGEGVVIPHYIEYKLALNCKFILHHSPNSLKVHEAWQHLQRSVRLRWHFRNTIREQSKFYVPKKSWSPPQDQWNHAIEKGLMKGMDLLFERTADLNPSEVHKSNPDLRSISEFLQSSQLLLKITDKNLGLAAISKSWYLERCESMLTSTTYDLIDLDIVRNHYRHGALERICDIANSGSFSEQVTEFLLSSEDDNDIPEFHAIPKVHKTPWTLRPIVPSHSWVTRKASEVCDFTLREFHKEAFPWIVDSTREVISRLNERTIVRSEQTWLVTGDVESFYTNVPTAETIEHLKVAFSGRKPSHGIDHERIPDLLEAVMACNCFKFNDNYFLQNSGVAMGTSCAPAFANVCLGFKEQFIESIAKATEHSKDGLILYVRYIDDILIVFNGTKSACQSSLDEISSMLQPFKIGWEINSSSQPKSFLDAEFFFDQGFGPVGLQSRVYRKRMNQHQYIPWSSAHPKSVKKAFIKAELTRYMIISSTKELFEERVREFMLALGRRGYPSTILKIWRKQVQYEDRSYSLSKRKDTSARGQPLMLPSSYDEIWEYIDLHDVFDVMRNEWVKCGEPLPLSLLGPLIKSLKRTENMFDKFSAWNKAVLRGPPEALVHRLL